MDFVHVSETLGQKVYKMQRNENVRGNTNEK